MARDSVILTPFSAGLTSPVGPTQGGTGLTTYNTGDMIYASAPNVLARRAIGNSGDVLAVGNGTGVPSWNTKINLVNLVLYGTTGQAQVDWGNQVLRDGITNSYSVDWGNHALMEPNGHVTHYWAQGLLADSGGNPTIDHFNKYLFAPDGSTPVVNWSDFTLHSYYFGIGANALDWGNGICYDGAGGGNTSIDWHNRYLYDASIALALDWNLRYLYDGFSPVASWDVSGLNLLSAYAFNIGEGCNFNIGSSVGTKIGTDGSALIGFWNAVPVRQQTAAGTTAGFTANSGSPLLVGSDFTGDLGSTAYTLGDIVLVLKTIGILAT